MAHNLLNDHMAFVGETPWHGLGTKVPADVNSIDMLRAAELDWQVHKTPAIGARVMKRRANMEIYDRYFLQRDRLRDERAGPVLGVVGAQYEVLQNHEAFAFFDPFLQMGQAHYTAAGALGNGERVWVQVHMGPPIEVAGGDIVERFILLSNTHDGRGALTLRFTPVRVVCQNTLNLALQGGEQVVNLRHSRNMRDRLADHQLEYLLRVVGDTFARAADQFRKLAKTPANADRKQAFMTALFPPSQKQKADGTKPRWWEGVDRVLADTRVTPPASRGSLWALYNAVTHAEDYRETTEATDDARLERVWFGRGAERKVKALQKALELCDG